MSNIDEIPGLKKAATKPAASRVTRTRLSRSKVARAARSRTAEDAADSGSSHAPNSAEPLIAPDDRRTTDDSHELTRRSRTERSVDQFAIPDAWKKRNWDYQYWVIGVLGQAVENSQFMEVHEGGWRPVLWKDVPKPWSPGVKGDEAIERLGQRLYTRPMALTKQAQQEDYRAAEQQRMDRVRSASEGRVSGGGGLTDIKGVVPKNLGVSVEGEVGTQAPRSRE